MTHRFREAAPLRIVMALIMAIVLAPFVRGATTELNHLAGLIWPFSLCRCHATATPGCEPVRGWRGAP